MKARIIKEARQLFNHFGVKTVRLEDVAHQVGISKKTLYQYFSSKEDLIRQTLEILFKESLLQARAIQTQQTNAITGALLIWDRLILYKQTVNPNLLRDIERHYPTVLSFFQTVKTHYSNTILIANLRAGVAQGLYRSDLEETLVAWWWLEQSQWDLPITGAESAIKHQFVRGLLTQQGLASYEQLLL